jgi:hypothetical protein
VKSCIACAEDIKSDAKLCKHCGTRQDDKQYLATPSPDLVPPLSETQEPIDTEGGDGPSWSTLSGLSTLIVVPTVFLLAADPTLSDGGPLEATGNASASIGGWSIFALLFVLVLLMFPQLRSSRKWRVAVKRLGYIFGLWAVIGLLTFGITILSAQYSTSTKAPETTSLENSTTLQTSPSVTTPAPSNQVTVNSCREYQTWFNSRPDAGEDKVGYLTDEQVKLTSLFRDVPDTRIRQAVNDHIAEIRLLKLLLSTNSSREVIELGVNDMYVTFSNLWDLCNDEY